MGLGKLWDVEVFVEEEGFVELGQETSLRVVGNLSLDFINHLHRVSMALHLYHGSYSRPMVSTAR